MGNLLGVLSIVAGIVWCIVISFIFFIPDLKKTKSTKEKWEAFLDFLFDPIGLIAGLFLIFFGLLKVSNLL